ncbi:MAG: transcription elongation factor GreA [Ignavibacteria bacterium]|nr:transcription elongation factor GreA [Ignavibacteria bacterium]
MGDAVYLTRERLLELEQDLNYLKTKARDEIARKIAEARSHGDLSENAEYDAAKEEQSLLELRISKLENKLARAQIIDTSTFSNDKVYILSKVKVLNLKANKEYNYHLVSPEEADYDNGKLSVTSPIGKELIGKKVGDIITVKAPAGLIEFKILEISK